MKGTKHSKVLAKGGPGEALNLRGLAWLSTDEDGRRFEFLCSLAELRDLREALNWLIRSWERGEADRPNHYGKCEDCGELGPRLVKGDHHGGTKTVCVDREACNARNPG